MQCIAPVLVVLSSSGRRCFFPVLVALLLCLVSNAFPCSLALYTTFTCAFRFFQRWFVLFSAHLSSLLWCLPCSLATYTARLSFSAPPSCFLIPLAHCLSSPSLSSSTSVVHVDMDSARVTRGRDKAFTDEESGLSDNGADSSSAGASPETRVASSKTTNVQQSASGRQRLATTGARNGVAWWRPRRRPMP